MTWRRILSLKPEGENVRIFKYILGLNRLSLHGVNYGVALKPAWIKGKHHVPCHCNYCS